MIELDLSMGNAFYESFMDVILDVIYAFNLEKNNE